MCVCIVLYMCVLFSRMENVGCKYFIDINFPDGNKHVRTAISQIITSITCRCFSAKEPFVV